MSLFFRRIIFYLILISFLISAPLIILYTAGYRYNFKQNRILKTGAIMITTDPKGASISLNDRKRRERTPARLLNLTPGEYTLRLNKNQYHPWQKKLKVESEQVTFVTDLIFFKNSLPQNIGSGEIIDFLLDERGNKLLYFKKDNGFYEVWSQEITDGSDPVLIWRSAFPVEPKFKDWSSKTSEILLKSKENFLLDLKQPIRSLIDLNKITKKDWDKIQFSITPNLLLGISNQNLYSINTLSGGTDLLAQEAANFSFLNSEIFFIQKEMGKIFLKMLKDGKETEVKHLSHAEYEFLDSTKNWIALYDRKNKNILLLSTKTNQKDIILAGEKVDWLDKEDLGVLVYSDFEIWNYTPSRDQKELIARIGERITNVFVHPSNNAFIVITENSIRAFELDTRDRQNVYELTVFDKILKAQIDQKGEIIYIAGIKEKTPGLWRLEIR